MGQRLTCLLVDDLEENLLALSAVLRRDDVEILTARSGAEALELLLAHDVALALVDVQMPEMDGFELAELMRGSERTRHIPIIFVTAASREPSRAFKGYHAGAVDFLYKPIDPLILESKARVFFELHRHRLALAEELRQRSETLRLNEMFTAVLGHDLRNPLNAILTGAFLLQRRSDDPAVRETAARILSSGQRMTRMIEDMLDLTRARLAGGIPLKRSSANLAAVVDRVVAGSADGSSGPGARGARRGGPHGRMGRRSPAADRVEPGRQRHPARREHGDRSSSGSTAHRPTTWCSRSRTPA